MTAIVKVRMYNYRKLAAYILADAAIAIVVFTYEDYRLGRRKPAEMGSMLEMYTFGTGFLQHDIFLQIITYIYL
jgi:hypothetical protein